MGDLHIVYRPFELNEVRGQDHIVKSLNNYIDEIGLPHSFLFVGPSGVGKTTVARILAKEVKCDINRIIEVDAATFTGIDAMRNLTSTMKYTGVGQNPNQVFIIDECHALSKQAWQSLLKVVEEPPEHVYFVFCTTEAGKVPRTIQTRCTKYDFKEASRDDLIDLLEEVAEEEGITFKDKGIIPLIANESMGSFRQSLVYLSMCHECKTKKEASELMSSGAESEEVIILCRALMQGTNFKKALEILSKIDDSVQSESIRLIIVNYFSKVILNSKKENMVSVLDAFSTPCNQSEKRAPIILALADLLLD